MNEMRMLRWMNGVTIRNTIRNEHCERISKTDTSDNKDLREKAKVVQACQEKGKRAHAETMVNSPIPGKRRRGRQQTRWKDSCKKKYGKCGVKGGGRIGEE